MADKHSVSLRQDENGDFWMTADDKPEKKVRTAFLVLLDEDGGAAIIKGGHGEELAGLFAHAISLDTRLALAMVSALQAVVTREAPTGPAEMADGLGSATPTPGRANGKGKAYGKPMDEGYL